jgi:hypothetical protein
MHNAEVLSSAPKLRQAVMWLMQEISALSFVQPLIIVLLNMSSIESIIYMK